MSDELENENLSEKETNSESLPEPVNEESAVVSEEAVITEVKAPKKKKKSRLFKFIVWSVCVLVFAAGFIFCFDVYNDYSGIIKPYGKISVNIPKGSNTDDVIKILKKDGVVKYPIFYKLYVKLSKTGGSYMRGIHTVTTDLGYKGVTEQLAKDAENLVKVTIPEGYWQSQIVDKFIDSGLGDTDSWNEALSKSYDYDFLKDINRENPLEGYIFPDTYIFYTDDTPEVVINTLLSQFQKVIDENDIVAKAEQIGMTLDDVVNLASIIQSEVPTMSEMTKVSAVFHNRLNIDMKLQSNVTVLYALGEHKSNVSIAETKLESPYNTYYVSGLPKGPICSPGADALLAAVTPDETITAGNYLFFYSLSSGEVIYSKTYAEHKAAIAKSKGGTGTATVG